MGNISSDEDENNPLEDPFHLGNITAINMR